MASKPSGYPLCQPRLCICGTQEDYIAMDISIERDWKYFRVTSKAMACSSVNSYQFWNLTAFIDLMVKYPMFPWENGNILAWDATVASSHFSNASISSGNIAGTAENDN